MKKIISMVLLCALIFNSISITVWSKEYDSVSEVQENEIKDQEYSDFEEYMYKFTTGNSYKYLVTSSNFSYMKFVSEFQSNVAELYLIEMIDRFAKTGAAPEVNDYIKALANIIIIYDRENAASVAEQKKMDNLKDWKSYAGDVFSMATDAFSVYSGLHSSDNEIAKGLKTAVDVLTTEHDNINNWIDTITNLETVLQDYSKYDSFLEMIEDNADGDLKEAASLMRNSMRKMLLVKLEAYAETEEENLENYSEFFYDKFVLGLAKKSSYYMSDEAFKFEVDACEKILDQVLILADAWHLGISIGKLAGNILVGGENLIERVIEMEALYDISRILQENILIENIQFLIDYNQKNLQADSVRNLEEMLRLLLATRQRGEYCIWNVVAKDAGMLSYFNYKNKEQANQWYQSQVNILSNLKDTIPRNEEDISKDMPAENLNGDESSSDISETENADISNTYLEFLEQYKEKEVFYSIQNIKEGGKPVLLLAFPSENEWESEFLDDNTIYSNSCEIYDYVDGKVVYLDQVMNLVGHLAVYRKEENEYVDARSNTHSYSFYCVKDDNLYYYAYNTNNIQEDTVEYDEQGEYYNYAYGTTNYDDAIREYSKVEDIVFQKYIDSDQNEKKSIENDSFNSQILIDFYNSYEWQQDVLSIENSMYELVDIEQDGIPELVIRNGTDSDVSYYVYYYDRDAEQIRYAGTFDNGFNDAPALYYSPSMKALSTYDRTSDSHWDMFYQLDHGEILLMPFEIGWFDSKNDVYIRHYYMSSDTEERKEIASSDWQDKEACKEAAEKYYSYISDLEYITFGNMTGETCYSHGEEMLSQDCQHTIYGWGESGD